MRCLCLSIVAAKVIVSTALMIGDRLEDALAAKEPPDPVTTSPIEGTWCNVAAVKGDITYYGIQLKRDVCVTSLSILGNTFAADFDAQATLPNYMKQLQCCVDVPCLSSAQVYGFCTNSDKECYKTLEIAGDCPALNSKCCVEEKKLRNALLVGTEDAFAVPDEGIFSDSGTTVSLDNPKEGSDFFSLSPLSENDDLFSKNDNPGLGTFNEADQSFFFGA